MIMGFTDFITLFPNPETAGLKKMVKEHVGGKAKVPISGNGLHSRVLKAVVYALNQ